MLMQLKEMAQNSLKGDRRGLPRLSPESNVVVTEVRTATGQVFRGMLGDISGRGARFLGKAPVNVGDEIRLGVHLDSSTAPYRTLAVVTHRNDRQFGARFILP